MPNIHLHHYPASPFSEKIRALLGVLDLEWYSVETSIIMPRPLLMPLSGGYRRIPVAQIGADVYCDTKIIARALAEHAGDDTLYAPGFVATRVADAADTELFRIMAALSFRPEAIAGMMRSGSGSGGGGGGFGGVSIQDFAKDRAEYDGGANLAGMPSDGEAALAEAKVSEPRALEPVAIGVDAAPGDIVRVTPTDVARVPVEGELVRADAQEFALRRTTDETGAVVTHFPRTGFALES